MITEPSLSNSSRLVAGRWAVENGAGGRPHDFRIEDINGIRRQPHPTYLNPAAVRMMVPMFVGPGACRHTGQRFSIETRRQIGSRLVGAQWRVRHQTIPRRTTEQDVCPDSCRQRSYYSEVMPNYPGWRSRKLGVDHDAEQLVRVSLQQFQIGLTPSSTNTRSRSRARLLLTTSRTYERKLRESCEVRRSTATQRVATLKGPCLISTAPSRTSYLRFLPEAASAARIRCARTLARLRADSFPRVRSRSAFKRSS